MHNGLNNSVRATRNELNSNVNMMRTGLKNNASTMHTGASRITAVRPDTDVMDKCSHCGGVRFADGIHVHAGSDSEDMFISLWCYKKTGPTEEHLLAKVCISCGTVHRFYIMNPTQMKQTI